MVKSLQNGMALQHHMVVFHLTLMMFSKTADNLSAIPVTMLAESTLGMKTATRSGELLTLLPTVSGSHATPTIERAALNNRYATSSCHDFAN